MPKPENKACYALPPLKRTGLPGLFLVPTHRESARPIRIQLGELLGQTAVANRIHAAPSKQCNKLQSAPSSVSKSKAWPRPALNLRDRSTRQPKRRARSSRLHRGRGTAAREPQIPNQWCPRLPLGNEIPLPRKRLCRALEDLDAAHFAGHLPKTLQLLARCSVECRVRHLSSLGSHPHGLSAPGAQGRHIEAIDLKETCPRFRSREQLSPVLKTRPAWR